MPLDSIPSRPSKESHRENPWSRVRPSPRSSKVIVSSAMASGMPSQTNVWMILVSLTSGKVPRKAYSSPSREAT